MLQLLSQFLIVFKLSKKEVADTTWTKDQYIFDTYIKESKLGSITISKIKLDDGYEFLEYCHSKYPK